MSSTFKLLITTDVTSEVWNYTVNLCETISNLMKIEILAVSLGGKPSKQQLEEANRAKLNVLFTEYPLNMGDEYDKYESNIREVEEYLSKAIKDFSPHIIHLNHYISSSMYDSPVILTCHQDILNQVKWVENINNPISENIHKYRNIITNAIKNADFIVVTSRFMAENLVNTYKFSGRIKIIYNGINYEPSSLLPDNPSIIIKSRFDSKFGNTVLLNKIIQRIPENIKIFFIGEKPFERVSARKITYLGNLSGEELKDAYRNASIYLALSKWDTFGFDKIKAAYSNCAIIANNIPVHRELWGDCACLFDRNNENSLIRCINNLAENENLLSLTAKNCQAKALSAFNSKKMGYEYINFYKNVLQRYTNTIKNQKLKS